MPTGLVGANTLVTARGRTSKHRLQQVRLTDGKCLAEWNATKPHPAQVKAGRRKKDKAARAARRANR